MAVRYKKKYKLKKKVKIFLLRCLALTLTIIVLIKAINIFINHINNKPLSKTDILLKEETYLNKYTDKEKILDKKYKDVIIKYMDTYYRSMIGLKTKDITHLFKNKNSSEAYLTQNALDLLIQHHKMQKSDMRLKNAKYDIEITEVNHKDNKTTVNFLENDYYNYNYLDDDITSSIYKVENTFVFDGEKLESIRIVQNYYIMFTNELDTITKDKIDDLKTDYINSMKDEVVKNNELMEEAYKKKYKTNIKCNGKYNREKAVEYNYKYINDRNPDYFAFDGIGGNCQNLASQSLHAGGIPFDLTGDYKWKSFSSELDETSEAKGRTSSWTGTQNFYEYVKYNKKGGVCADPDINMFYAEIGDVGHVGYIDYSHAVLVVDLIKNNEGKVIDLLINANSVNVKDYPFLAYVYPNKRIIKILGYN